ncbi:hypothetical protein B9Z19DRAFT_1080520 [Tuber borchii]|uniref:Uncharacterized protein n=1 Tax=Tuber borchii TaxID=42251 RepID=A0A2T6ZWY2_TUBBO|nr:hypothetical protein B9Z19DRAFT_1080520 [Tuber borchii]
MCLIFLPLLFPLHTSSWVFLQFASGVNVGVVCLNCRLIYFFRFLFGKANTGIGIIDRYTKEGGLRACLAERKEKYDALFKPSTIFKLCCAIREIVLPYETYIVS